MKKLASWNVNGIRACLRKGFADWVKQEKPDVICLQETKTQDHQFFEAIKVIKGYVPYHAQAVKKGYSGTALLIKEHYAAEVILKLGDKKFDDEGRTNIAIFDDFILINGYFPNGQRDHNRVPYKLEFSKKMAKKALSLKKKYGKEVIVCGDYNTAHQEIDLKNPKTNQDTTGFLPIEREWIDEFIKQGFVDLFRHFHPDKPDHYTWWTYRGDCRARNVGWRIDYFFCSKPLVDSVKKVIHRPKVLGSDHCPLILNF